MTLENIGLMEYNLPLEPVAVDSQEYIGFLITSNNLYFPLRLDFLFRKKNRHRPRKA